MFQYGGLCFTDYMKMFHESAESAQASPEVKQG